MHDLASLYPMVNSVSIVPAGLTKFRDKLYPLTDFTPDEAGEIIERGSHDDLLAMKGRYYGGGMIPTPKQSREAEDRELSIMIFHGSSAIKTLMIFPSIFKGEHIKSVKHVTVHTGKDITVRFDSPRSLQIDGETILGVEEYNARV